MARATFPRCARLLTARDFARLRTCSRRVASRNLVAEVAPSETGGVRMGLAVSRKVSRKAVRRNRIKRIARDSFRHHRASFQALDILVIARSSADLQDNPTLHAEFAQLWQRIMALNATGAPGKLRD
jgi:ribonuclease P protein component